MADYRIIKLKNLTPRHIGDGREDSYDFASAIIDSDSISSALASIFAENHTSEETLHWMQKLRISSSMPWQGGHYFLPSPVGRLNVEVEDLSEELSRKKMKKIKYLDVNFWEQIANGCGLKIPSSAIHDEFLCNDALFDQLITSRVHERVCVTLDETEDATPFYFNWHYFRQDAGLYFIVADIDDDGFSKLVELFRMLGEQGIGTDRSVGGGGFEVDTGVISVSTPAYANAQILLSTFIPSEEEIGLFDLEHSRYKLLRRGGYMAGSSIEALRHLHRREIFLFTTGSVFATSATLVGKVVDLAPSWNSPDMHPVYRSGIPFVLPIKNNMP